MRDIDARIFELIRNKGVQAGYELIKRAKQEWEATADSLVEMICLVDRQGYIIRANRTVETWNLGTVRDVKGKNLHDLFHPNCPAASCFLENFLYQAWGELPLGNSSMCEFRDRLLGRYIRVQVRREFEIVQTIGKEPAQKDMWTVALSGPVGEGVWFECHDECLGQAVVKLYVHMVGIRRDI